MTLFSRRAIAALAIATVAAFPMAGSTAQAHETSAKKTTHSHKAQVKKTHVKKFHAKFALHGKVTAVSSEGITVKVKGSNLKKAIRHTEVSLTVNETTKITVGDDVKTLADIVVGDRVVVKGTRALAEGVVSYTAKRVHAKHAKAATTVTETVPAPTSTAIAS